MEFITSENGSDNSDRYFIVTKFKGKCSLCQHTAHLVLDVEDVTYVATRIFDALTSKNRGQNAKQFSALVEENISDARIKSKLYQLYAAKGDHK